MNAPARPTSKWVLGLALLGVAGCGVDSVDELPGWVALCQVGSGGSDCECSGVLVTPSALLTARHCNAPVQPDVVAGYVDPADVPDDEVRSVVSRCRQNLGTDEACFELTAAADVDALFLDAPVDAENAVPVRLASIEDRIPGANYVAMGRGPGTFRAVDLGEPRSCVVGPTDYGALVPGPTLCFDSPPSGPDAPALESGDSGGPLYVETAEGEFALVGIFSATQGGLAIFVDLETRKPYIPGSGRPGFTVDTDTLLPWNNRCVWLLPDDLIIYPLSTRSADFDGDGNDEGFFESDEGVPYMMREPEELLLETGPLTAAATYPFANLATPLTDGGVADMVTVGVDGTMRASRWALDQWDGAPFADVDLTELDPFWNGADLAVGFEPERFAADPLLRAADVDGDGLTDIVASLEQNLVVLRNTGQSWIPTVTPFENLGIPNAPEYRQSITLADITAGSDGDELLVRRPCGLAVFSFDAQQGWVEQFDQSCDEAAWVASDTHGYGADNRWRVAAGDLNGDACADVIVRSDSEVYQLFASCDPQGPTSLAPGPDTGLFFRGPIASYTGWSEGLQGSLRLGDIDGDGLDDLVANSPFGVQVHINQNDQQLPFASVGGLDPELQAAARPYLEIDNWGDFAPGRFNAVNREFISYNATLACYELFWLFD